MPCSSWVIRESRIYARGSYVRLLNIPIGKRHMRLRLNYQTTEQIRSAASSVVTVANALTGEALGGDDSISLALRANAHRAGI